MSTLYLDYFGLRSAPFQITPDPDFFFSGGRRGDILSALLHIADHDEGITTLIAEVGSGKTMLARLMIARLKSDVTAVYLANPCFSRDEIIVAIARDLGLTGLDGSIEGKLAVLHQELLRRHAGGQRVLLVIDEAHAMPAESLEEVRLLSNLETARHKLVNIMLFGQPELDALLGQSRLRQVLDRVIHRFELPPLRAGEINAYVDHRLRAAGWQGAGLFSTAALARLVKASGGRARRINLLADKALLVAYAKGERSVSARHVADASVELRIARSSPSNLPVMSWRLVGWSLTLALVMTAAAVGLLGWYRSSPDAMSFTETSPLAQSPRSRSSSVPTATPEAATSGNAVVAPAAASSASGLAAAAPAMAAANSSAVPTVGSAAALAVVTGRSKPGLSDGPANPSPGTVSPASTQFDAILARTQAWIGGTDLKSYAIQLAALPADASPQRYLNQVTTALDASKVYAQHSIYNGKLYLAVYFGNFESEKAAALFVNELPEALKKNRPLVRAWANIKGDQVP